MPDGIPNALTPEEWKKEDAAVVWIDRDGPTPTLGTSDQGDIEFGRLPAVMALANAALPDEDPRKITRRDVMAIEDAAAALRAEFGRDEDDARLLDAIVAKLAALLPPMT